MCDSNVCKYPLSKKNFTCVQASKYNFGKIIIALYLGFQYTLYGEYNKQPLGYRLREEEDSRAGQLESSPASCVTDL